MRKILSKYDIPEPILARWEERFSGRLLPLQHRALEEYRLFDGTSLLISAPTSSGKTFCGEMALVRAVLNRQKGLYLVPLKAVAEEKLRQFLACYGAAGLRVLIGSRDYPENDVDIENGRFDIAILVYEKFNSLLLANFDILGQVGTVVVDELQMMEDDSRGAQLELSLTKLLYSEYRPQLVALSAVLGEATELAEWLQCRLLLEKSRPVELRRGVVSDGTFYFRCHNSGETGSEPFQAGEDVETALFENIHEAYGDDRQVLVFLKKRLQTVQAALRFAEYAGLTSAAERADYFHERLIDEERTSLLDNLVSLLACGVAFHNADLTPGQRAAVEDGYREGYIRVIFATTTLSTGINLPAETVFVEAQKFARQTYTGRPGLEPLSWAEYESMSGRAGRMGMVDDRHGVGRAVLFASGELEKSILWDYYIDKLPQPLTSQLPSREAEDIIIDIIGSELVDTPEKVERLLEKSYCASCKQQPINVKQEKYEVLLNDGFLIRDGSRLLATPLGMAVAISGLSVAGVRHMLAVARDERCRDADEIIYAVLKSPDAGAIYLPMSAWRGRSHLSEHLRCGDGRLLARLTALRREPAPEERHRLSLVSLLLDWMNGASALDIENNYQLHPGMMDNLARQAGWLLSGASAAIKAHDRYSRLPSQLERLAFSAGTGLPHELKGLADDVGGVLYRREILALYGEGIETTGQLLEAGSAIVEKVVSSPHRRENIQEKLRHIKEQGMRTLHGMPAGLQWPQSIEIDGTPVRERYRVRINGRTFNLTGKSFKYLCRLAWSRLTNENGWLYKEELEQGFNQARYLYRLRQEIGRDFLPEWPLYENNRSGYYRLAAPRDKIMVNVDALKDNPDYEIRQMAGDLIPLAS